VLNFRVYGDLLYKTRYIKGRSHTMAVEIERILDKFSSRRQGRSQLKYTNCRVCISLERKFCPLKESLGL
jgi:hypothetical protein